MKTKTTLVVLASVLLVLGVLGVVVGDSDSANVQASVSVLGAISVTADSFGFGSMSQGGTNSTVVDIDVVSNAPYDLTTVADSTTFSDGSKSFAVGNMSWSNDEGTTWNAYDDTNLGAIVSGEPAPGTNYNIGHQLTIPSDQEAGSYSVGVILTATQV